MANNEAEVSTFVVPYKPDFGDLAKTHADFHSKWFEQSRWSLLSELRCLSGLPELARSLRQDSLYKLVWPEGQVLQQVDGGLYRGVFYGQGGVQAHAKFARVGPNLMKAATAAGGQVLLISIAMQLNRIEKSLENLSVELHRDRLAEIYSGVQQFETAMRFQDPSHRAAAIHNAIQTVDVGLQKTIFELGSLIAKAPDPNSGILDHIVCWNDKTKTAAKIMQVAEESFRASLLGISTLAECYAAINETGAAARTLSGYLDRIYKCDMEHGRREVAIS